MAQASKCSAPTDRSLPYGIYQASSAIPFSNKLLFSCLPFGMVSSATDGSQNIAFFLPEKLLCDTVHRLVTTADRVLVSGCTLLCCRSMFFYRACCSRVCVSSELRPDSIGLELFVFLLSFHGFATRLLEFVLIGTTCLFTLLPANLELREGLVWIFLKLKRFCQAACAWS